MGKKKEKITDEVPKLLSDPHKLAGIGSTAELRELIEHPKNPVEVDILDKFLCTPFLWAARNGKLDTMKYLVESGADVNKAGYGGMTALHHAANNLHVDVLTELLSLGADCKAQDDAGNTALHWACERGALNPIQALIDAGSNVNQPNKAKSTPLHKAVNNGQSSVVTLLVKSGADVQLADAVLNTSLHIAVISGFITIVEQLLEAGANPEAKNKSNKVPGQLSTVPAITNLFVSNGGDEGKQD